jgi:hypothetical protein
MDVGGVKGFRMPSQAVVNVVDLQSEKVRGGRERVAHRFLPASPIEALIRLDGRNLRRARSRRRLARLIDRRENVS